MSSGTKFCFITCCFLVVSVLAVGCNSPKKKGPKKKTKSMRVVAVSYPLQYLAQRIVGDKVDVEFPISAEQDPRSWSPSADQVSQLRSADVVIVNGPGAAYAKWLVQVTLPDSRICSAANDLSTDDYFLVDDYQIVHTHGGEGEHSHPYTVPYSWLDPAIAKKQADTIAKSLRRAYPDMETEIDENLAKLHADLDELSQEFQAAASVGTLVVSTPDAKFLTRAMGFEDKHLLLFDFENVSRNDAVARITKLGDQDIKKFVWVDTAAYRGNQEQKAKMLEQLFPKGQPDVVQIDLMDHPPQSGDYLTGMRELLRKFK